MSKTSQQLLIIFEAEAEQWVTYLRSVLAGFIPETDICCCNIGAVTSRRDDFTQLSCYKCKLLILSRGMVEGLCMLRRFFLARVLRPESSVVVLLCGVDSLEPLLEAVPLKGDECLQISSEQDAQEYSSAVLNIIYRDAQTSTANMKALQELKLERKPSAGRSSAKSQIMVLPSRVPCKNPGVVFLLLREAVASTDLEVEFTAINQKVRVKPVNWNETTLSVAAADLPAGSVDVTLYSAGVTKGRTQLHYYTAMGEISRLLKQAADPVDFMCQAFQLSSIEKLDHVLASCLMKKMPTGGFQGLQSDQTLDGVTHSKDIPTLLHFAAQHGLKDLSSILLQCPGAQQAMRTRNLLGHTPIVLAHTHGHSQLHILLQESLAKGTGEYCDDDTSVYELMGRTENLQVTYSHMELHTAGATGDSELAKGMEDTYADFEENNEEYESISTPNSPAAIVNRPPAPAPRPEKLQTKDDNMPYIAQVFQKKMSQRDSDILYSLPANENRGRESVSSTYDTFVPSPAPRLDELIKLQEQVKNGSLSMDDALERFSDWQRVQRGTDAIQQENLQQLRASIMNNRENNDSVYDKINIVHHTPNVTTNECRRGSQEADPNVYSKPIRGQNSKVFRKAEKH